MKITRLRASLNLAVAAGVMLYAMREEIEEESE